MAKNGPAADALAALEQIIDGFTSFRDAFEAALGGSGSGSGDDGAESEVPAKRGRGAGKAADVAPAAGKAAGKGAAKGSASTGKGKKAAPTVTFEELKHAFTQFVKDNGVSEAKTLLGTLGVEKLSELDEDQYADALAGIQSVNQDGGEEESEDDDLL